MAALDILIQPIWEVSPYPIAVINFGRDPELRKFVYVNPAFTDLTGYSSAEAVGRPPTLLNGPKTNQAAIEECRAAVVQGKPSRATLVHYRKDGSEYTAHTTVAPLIESDGHADFLMLVETVVASPNPELASEAANNNSGLVSLSLRLPLKELLAGEVPQHLLSHPELDDLQALWSRLRGHRRLPQRTDFDLKTVSRWASHLSIATVMFGGRFRFRLFGTELARIYGQDLTGRYLDDLTPKDLWSLIILHYQDVVKTLQPLFAPVSISNGRWYSEVSRLVLPLAAEGDGNKVAFIMAADYTRSTY